jgi:EmrB/QacA subfamily drug resistance transporter
MPASQESIAQRTQTAETGHPQRWIVLGVLCAVAFMAQLDLFIVNVALPAMGRSFPGQGLSKLSWVLNAYAIVFAACLVPAGRLADHLGRKRCLLAGVALFTLASALCAGAPDLAMLLGARAVQAVGAAMIVPTSLGLLLPAFAQRQHGMVVGIWAGVAAIAASSGPPVGGLLVEASWRWVFLVNVPIGIATLVLGRAILPEVRAHPDAKLPDMVAAISVLLSITLLTLATVEGSTWGWTSHKEGLLAAGFVVTLSFTVRRILGQPIPLVEPALFRSRPFAAAAVALLLFFMGFAAWLLGTVLFFENTWHYSTLRAGLAIAPGPVVAAVFALNSGRLSTIFGRRLLAIVGPLLFAGASVFWLVSASASPNYLSGFLPGLLLGGASAGLTQAPLFAATSTLPPDRATTGSAVLSMARQVGSALGVAIVVAVYSSNAPHLLASFRRGWVFIATVALLAAAVSFVVRDQPATSRSDRRRQAERLEPQPLGAALEEFPGDFDIA